MERLKLHTPRIGMRTIKTIISATLIAIIYSFFDRNACFACIGAVFGMGNAFRGGLQSGGNRFLGTLIGGLVSIPFYFLYHSDSWRIPVWLYLSFGLLLLITICQSLRAWGSVQPGSVVFFVVIYTIGEAVHLDYVIARIIDTGIGVLLSLCINHFFPSPLDLEAREKAKLERAEKIARMEREKTDAYMISYDDLIDDRDFPDEESVVKTAQHRHAHAAAPVSQGNDHPET